MFSEVVGYRLQRCSWRMCGRMAARHANVQKRAAPASWAGAGTGIDRNFQTCRDPRQLQDPRERYLRWPIRKLHWSDTSDWPRPGTCFCHLASEGPRFVVRASCAKERGHVHMCCLHCPFATSCHVSLVACNRRSRKHQRRNLFDQPSRSLIWSALRPVKKASKSGS